MRARQDPIALALAAKFPGVRMPYLQIHASDAADLIAYIDANSNAPQPRIALESLYALTTQDGTHLTPADLKGRPFAVLFGYTHCPDVCPTTLLQWSNLIGSLEASLGGFRLLFISVDQERDSPSVLKALLASFDQRITGLTGSSAEIAAAAQQFDFALHLAIADHAGNFALAETIRKIWTFKRISYLAAPEPAETLERGYGEHLALLAALAAHDAETARAAMLFHLLSAVNLRPSRNIV